MGILLVDIGQGVYFWWVCMVWTRNKTLFCRPKPVNPRVAWRMLGAIALCASCHGLVSLEGDCYHQEAFTLNSLLPGYETLYNPYTTAQALWLGVTPPAIRPPLHQSVNINPSSSSEQGIMMQPCGNVLGQVINNRIMPHGLVEVDR